MADWRVDDWLEGLGLGSYLNDFIDNGYESRALCANLKPEELDVIGVKDKKHRALLLVQAKQLCQSNDSEPNGGVTPQNYTEPWAGNSPQNYTEPWAGNNTAYTEPWQQKNTGDKKTNMPSTSKGADHTSVAAAPAKKKGHATLPASIAKHHRSVQPEQLPHFVGGTGGLTKLQLKLKMKDVLQKDRIVLTEPPYVSKDGELHQPSLEALAETYGVKFTIDSQRVFEALKEVWGVSMNISTGALPVSQQTHEKSKTLPSSISLPAGSDYQEPFKGPEPVKTSIPIDKQSKEDIPIVVLTTENILVTPSLPPNTRPISVRLHDSGKGKLNEPMYEDIDETETPPGHVHKRFSHVRPVSLSQQSPATSHSSLSDGVKKTHEPCREESEDVFPSEQGHKLTSEGGNEATKSTDSPSQGFISKLFRKFTTKHSSTKSLSVAPGSPKLASSKSMPAIADMKAISKSSDDISSSEYSEVFDKVPIYPTQNARSKLASVTAVESSVARVTAVESSVAKVAAVESSVVPQERTNEIKPAEPVMFSSKDQSSTVRKESTEAESSSMNHLSKAGSISMDRTPEEDSTSMDHIPEEDSTSMDRTPGEESTSNHSSRAGSTPMDHSSRAGSTPMDHSPREGFIDDMAETCSIPYAGSKPSIAPKPHPRPSKKPASDDRGALGTPPLKPKRSMRHDVSPPPQTNVDSKTAEVASNKNIQGAEPTVQSLPAVKGNWDDKNLKPGKPQPKPRPRNIRSTAAQQEQGDREDSQPP